MLQPSRVYSPASSLVFSKSSLTLATNSVFEKGLVKVVISNESESNLVQFDHRDLP